MGYLCDWMNDSKSVQWFSFLNISQNRWATNLLQEDQSLNHSIICYWFLSLLKVRMIDYLTYCVNQRIKESTNTWMDKRCSFYAVNNNHKIIITNKLAFCYKDIVYSIILSSSHLLLFLSRECMIEGLNRCLFCMLLSIHFQQTTRQIRIATIMKLVMQMDIKIVDWKYENENEFKSMSRTKRKWNEWQQRQQNVNKQGYEFCFKSLKCQFKTVSDIK